MNWLTGKMACPMADAAFNVTRLGNVQNRTTDSAKFDIVHADVPLLEVFDKGGHGGNPL